ncbi:protealysin inhibitor emfourin [Variovorax sp. M-6]|uniref:protealysin inhibitor emfourin n=1 Tax=Variovorax sp. M-6 TaxID=3233041 RepID=UPI003F9CEFE6
MTQPAGPSRPTVRSVRIERRGGLAGLAVSATHDYVALSAAQQQALAQVIEAAASHGPARVRGAPAGPAPGADRLSYRLHVQYSAGVEQVLDVSDDAMPSVLESLAKPSLP